LELVLALIAEAGLLAVVGELVVDLPAPDARVGAVATAELVHDLRHAGKVALGVPAGVLPGAVGLPAAGGVDHQDLRMLFREPDRGRGRRRAEHHLQTLGRGELDVLVEPRKIELVLRGLQERPRELAEVHELEAESPDVREVPRPLARGPRLGIVVDAEVHQVGRRKAVGRGVGLRGHG
jgi:hypothetical protein